MISEEESFKNATVFNVAKAVSQAVGIEFAVRMKDDGYELSVKGVSEELVLSPVVSDHEIKVYLCGVNLGWVANQAQGVGQMVAIIVKSAEQYQAVDQARKNEAENN